jgi:hypothetical protein
VDIERVEAKLDKIVDSVSSINTTLAVQVKVFEEHVKADERMRSDFEEHKDAVKKAVKPIQKHVAMMQGALKLIGIVCLIGGTVAGIIAAVKAR